MGKRGFTLVELSVVFGLIGLFLLFSLPTLANFKEQVYLDATATQFASDLRKTQIEALCFNTTRTISINNRQFIFSKTGNPQPGGSGTVVLNGRSCSRSLIVSSVGRVRIE
jgi:prepilin-type N-terminal cleavage/methylation domain-containing protein